MPQYSFHELKMIIEKQTARGAEPEISLILNEKEYMIIGYSDYVSFQRCGYSDGSGEFRYSNLDELYNTKTVDNILLSRDWHKIKSVNWDEI